MNGERGARNAGSVGNSELETRNAEWMTVRLGDVVDIDRVGIDGSKLELNQRYLGLEHLDSDGKIRWGETVESAGVKSSKFRFTRKHVLFGKLRPYLRKVVRPEQDGVCSTDILPLLPKSGVDRGFIYHLLRTDENTRRATEACSGANLPGLSPGKFRAFEFRVPRSLAAQRRIAEILDAADRLRAQRRETLAQLDTLLQSTFLELFGDPVTNPKGWEVVQFKDIGQSRLGKMLDKGKEKGDCQFPYLANYNVQWNRFELDSLREMDFTKADRAEFELKTGDLLICEGGEVGRAAIWRKQRENVYFQKALHRVRLNPEMAVPEFTLYYMWFMAKNGGFRDFTNSATIAHLTGAKLKGLPVPVPPLDLQRRFAAIVESVEKQKARQRAHLAELDALFASLQSRAFNGEL